MLKSGMARLGLIWANQQRGVWMNKAVKNGLIGCYVTGTLVVSGYPRQGVFVCDYRNGTVLLVGESGVYLCKGPEDLTYAKTLNCQSTPSHIEQQRQLIDNGYYE